MMEHKSVAYKNTTLARSSLSGFTFNFTDNYCDTVTFIRAAFAFSQYSNSVSKVLRSELCWVCFWLGAFLSFSAQPEGARMLRVCRAERTDLSNAPSFNLTLSV